MPITREQLAGFLDDALGDLETVQVEQALRDSAPLRQQLRAILQERDCGEHSLGAIWRRNRLSCPTRENLGSYLLQALDKEQTNYLEFHLKIVGCSFCQANLADLQNQHHENTPDVKDRRQRFFESSAGLLQN